MKDQQNNEQQHAFSSKDLEGFLKRLGIPVNGETMSLAFAIDFAMRRGNRADAEAAARDLIALFQDEATELDEFDEREEYNDNALDRAAPAATLIGRALQYYENMQITLQAADPEETMGEIYSDEMMNRIAGHAGLPNDPLIKPWLKRIGEAFATGGEAGARREASGLIGHLVADGYIDGDAARAEMLNKIVDTVAVAENSIDHFGDADGNEDLYNELPETDETDQEDAGIDLSLKEEEDRRRAEEAARTREENRRVNEEYGRLERALFVDIAGREDGLMAQLGLDVNNPDDAALGNRLIKQMRAYEMLRGGPSQSNIEAMTAVMAEIEAIAAALAQRLSRDENEAAEIAGELRGEIINEARELTRQHEAQLVNLGQQARATVQEQMRQEAGGTDTPNDAQDDAGNDPRDGGEAAETTNAGEDTVEAPSNAGKPGVEPAETDKTPNPDPADTTDLDVQKVAAALRDNGMKEAQRVALRIAGMLRAENDVGVPEDAIAEDLLVRAQAFIVADDEYMRRDEAAVRAAVAEERAAREKTAKQASRDDSGANAGEDNRPASSGDTTPGGETNQEDRVPRLSDYQSEFQTISFLLAEGNPQEARTAAATLAETLRALGGEFARIDAETVLKHVIKEDKKKSDAKAAEQSENDADDDGLSDRAGWFLMMALDKDAKSAEVYDALVRAVMRDDRQTAGKLIKALANHILKLYKTNVTITEMMTAIVNAAKQDAAANRDDISEFSVDDSDSDDGSFGGEGSDEDDLSDRASWFLMMALDKDAKSDEIYEAMLRAFLKGDKKTGGKLAKALAGHILKLYKTNVTLQEMLTAIINAAQADVKANRENEPDTSPKRSDRTDKDGDGAIAGAATKASRNTQSTFDLSTVKKVDWGSLLSIYSMDPEEKEAAAEVAKQMVKKGKDSPGVLTSAKDLLSRSNKKVKGAKVKNHKHFVAALEDALVKKSESKKVTKPLKFADIPDDVSEDISV